MTATDQGDIDAHNSAVDKLIAAILEQACRDAMCQSMKPRDQSIARCATLWLSVNGCEYIEHLGWGEQDLLDYLSGARQPALRMFGN